MIWHVLAAQPAPDPTWWLDTYVETARDIEAGQVYSPRASRAHADHRGPLWTYVERVVRVSVFTHFEGVIFALFEGRVAAT